MRGAIAGAVIAVVAVVAPGSGARSKEPALAGEINVVDFWAPWCKPCVAERPMVTALTRALATDGRVRVYEANVDDQAGARFYRKLFGGGEVQVPRLVVVDRDLGGLERVGAAIGEDRDHFVRDVSAAVSALEAGGTPAPPSPRWQPFVARKHR